MVGINSISLELCGGTHVEKTGDIGLFKILSEGGIAAGVRRIEALTGRWAYNYTKLMEQKLDELSTIYKCSIENVIDKTQKLIATNKELEKKIGSLQASIAKDDVSDILKSVREVNGIKVLSAFIDNKETKYLREYSDMFKDKLKSAVIVLASEYSGKVSMTASVTKDLTDRCSAGKILKTVLEKFGGRGGGKPDMAQGGGIKKEDVKKALEFVFSLV
jgi:alanyl-tRNA synthetase